MPKSFLRCPQEIFRHFCCLRKLLETFEASFLKTFFPQIISYEIAMVFSPDVSSGDIFLNLSLLQNFWKERWPRATPAEAATRRTYALLSRRPPTIPVRGRRADQNRVAGSHHKRTAGDGAAPWAAIWQSMGWPVRAKTFALLTSLVRNGSVKKALLAGGTQKWWRRLGGVSAACPR